MSKHQNEAKQVKKIDAEVMKRRLNIMLEMREEYLRRIAEEGYETVLKEMRLQQGNSKTGLHVWTVSLIPIVDCPNCSKCKDECYDIRNVCWMTNTQNDRARNSALHKANPKRFWERVEELVKENMITQLRINVGGDLTTEDFGFVNELGKNCKRTDILFFTKNYDGINSYISENGDFVPNVKAMMSAWCGMEMENPHNLPTTHVLWADGRTTAPEFGSYYCGGNCSECHFNDEGCWVLKKGESVIFLAH